MKTGHYSLNLIICSPLIAKSGPVKIRVSGIDCMNNNYKKVDVLYANAKLVDESEDLSLQKLVNELSDHFYDRGKRGVFVSFIEGGFQALCVPTKTM